MAGLLTDPQLQLIATRTKNFERVVACMMDKKAMNKVSVNDVLKLDTDAKRRYFMMDYLNRRGEYEFKIFIDSLVATNQTELANALRPNSAFDQNLNPLPNDGNSLRGGMKGGGDQIWPTDVNGQGSTSTNPLLSDLRVIKSTGLPHGFNLKDCYRHISNPKGLALIINNRHFKTHGERVGTEVDGRNLNILFSQLGYKVEIHNDLTAQQMYQAIAEFSTKPEHAEADSAMVVVLSHGKLGKIYGSDDESVDIDGFIKFLNNENCPKLLNKPKIFILQACRGEYFDYGVANGRAWTGIDGGGDKDGKKARQLAEMVQADTGSIARIALGVDMLIAFSTAPDYVSFRNEDHGAWFIQCICNVFANHTHNEDILHLFTKVNDEMSKRSTIEGSSGRTVVQASSKLSYLTKKFYLLPGYYG